MVHLQYVKGALIPFHNYYFVREVQPSAPNFVVITM
jgi:hypothetical protein